MTNNEMLDKLFEFLNTEKGKSFTKPLFDQAIAEGKIKTQKDMDNFKTGFILSLIQNNKDLWHIFSTNVYNELREQ